MFKNNLIFALLFFSASDQLIAVSPSIQVPLDKTVELAQNALKDANEQRKQNDKSPLIWSQDLADQAIAHTKIMGDTKKLSHDGFMDRYNAISKKHSGLAMAENVAQTFEQADVAQAVTDMWMKSPGHRANLLGNYKYCGISFYQSGSNWYATAIYADW